MHINKLKKFCDINPTTGRRDRYNLESILESTAELDLTVCIQHLHAVKPYIQLLGNYE